MRQLIAKQLNYDLTPLAELALGGDFLNASLLTQGKGDFDAIEN